MFGIKAKYELETVVFSLGRTFENAQSKALGQTINVSGGSTTLSIYYKLSNLLTPFAGQAWSDATASGITINSQSNGYGIIIAPNDKTDITIATNSSLKQWNLMFGYYFN